jgi:hypothetical protein
MNEVFSNKLRTRGARISASTHIALATALAVSVLIAQPTPISAQAAEWPKGVPHKAAIDAFTKTLTRASRDSDFRQKLLKPESAKTAVAQEGNIKIPDEIVIVFYEPEKKASSTPSWSPQASTTKSLEVGTARMTELFRTDSSGTKWVNVFRDIGSNENYHIFCLPPFDRNGTKTYQYSEYLTGAYPVWWD